MDAYKDFLTCDRKKVKTRKALIFKEFGTKKLKRVENMEENLFF